MKNQHEYLQYAFEGDTEPSFEIPEVILHELEIKAFNTPRYCILEEPTKYSTAASSSWQIVMDYATTFHNSAGLTSPTVDLLARSRKVNFLLQTARDSIKCFVNNKLSLEAYYFLEKLYSVLMKCDPSNLQPIRAYENEECILLEWIYSHWRIGFALDENQKDSSWFIVSDNTAGDLQASGSLVSADIQWIVDWLIRRTS